MYTVNLKYRICKYTYIVVNPWILIDRSIETRLNNIIQRSPDPKINGSNFLFNFQLKYLIKF